MITEPTVLILGAGASFDYGFPLGGTLRDLIATMREGDDRFNLTCDALGMVQSAPLKRFVDHFAGSNYNSIDKFLSLETLPANFLMFGKVAIAATLCCLEDPNRFDNNPGWYGLLWNALTDELKNPSDLDQTLLTVLTFNYDRSLEYFLNLKTQITFGVDEKAAASILKNIKFIHLYGSLGKFAPGDPDHLPYRALSGSADVLAASQSLRVIPEHRESEIGTFEAGRVAIQAATRVMFLGFGFDPLNLKRLNFAEAIALRDINSIKIALFHARHD